jgi:hypothetical protein
MSKEEFERYLLNVDIDVFTPEMKELCEFVYRSGYTDKDFDRLYERIANNINDLTEWIKFILDVMRNNNLTLKETVSEILDTIVKDGKDQYTKITNEYRFLVLDDTVYQFFFVLLAYGVIKANMEMNKHHYRDKDNKRKDNKRKERMKKIERKERKEEERKIK